MHLNLNKIIEFYDFNDLNKTIVKIYSIYNFSPYNKIININISAHL